MDENKLNRMKKLAKKLADINDDLQILIDAQMFAVINSGEETGIVAKLKSAQNNILKALYNFALAEADAEGEEVSSQIAMHFDKFAEANKE